MSNIDLHSRLEELGVKLNPTGIYSLEDMQGNGANFLARRIFSEEKLRPKKLIDKIASFFGEYSVSEVKSKDEILEVFEKTGLLLEGESKDDFLNGLNNRSYGIRPKISGMDQISFRHVYHNGILACQVNLSQFHGMM